MSAELDSIISSAMAGIDGGSDGGDTGDTGDSGGSGDGDTGADAVDLPATDAADAGADAGAEDLGVDVSGQPVVPVADGGRSAEDLAFDAELAELGLAAPKPGQKDNRIPYSRIRKIVANAKTKWSDKLKGEHTTELTAREQKIKDFEDREARLDALVESNPDEYISLLGRMYPDKYKGFTRAKVAAAKAAEKVQEPQPDVKYDDGSLGYSPEQFAKLREYDRKESARLAREESSKEFNERFGPIEREYRATQQNHQDVARVRGHIGKLREQWGADVIDNPDVQKAIIAHMDANPKATLVEAARTVALGRIRADRTTMRAELLKELKGAPRAADRAPVAPNRSDTADLSGSLDDIIRNAARGIK